MKYLHTNILGCFIFDNQFNLVERVQFKSVRDYENKKKTEVKLKNKYRDWKDVPEKKKGMIVDFFRDKKYFSEFYQMNLRLTKQKIKNSVSPDLLIIQTISNIEELTKMSNTLVKRLREWYSWYCPEFSHKIEDNLMFTELIIKKQKKDLLRDFKLGESMGADLKKEDVQEMILLGKEAVNLFKLRKKHEEYLQKVMKKHCPNILELAGAVIGAKLIELGKGLRHLALLPASTVQLLGAEKALFRHIKTNAKCPKFGVIHAHPLVQKAGKKNQGKMARTLADKLSLCARLDFFKGEFKAKEYRKELEKRLKEIS
tara:strand:+ start:1231 stop:2172 length:942 start_codon:yes stop_codon:yes gene_type:complete